MTQEAQEVLMKLLEHRFVQAWHDGEYVYAEGETMSSEVFNEIDKAGFLDMHSGNHLYTTYVLSMKADVYTYIL